MLYLRRLWDSLRSTLWFIPALLVVGSVCLALALIEAGAILGQNTLERNWPRLFGAGASGARAMLSAIASSMITVAGVAFSITVVTLTLAASQYSSRILRNFMRDRANQTVLGVFTGVFAYCLVVLRTIRGGDEGAFVPSLAVFFAVVLAFVAIGFLIYFIHHISYSIQATNIIKSVSDETVAAIDHLFPEDLGEEPDQSTTPPTASIEHWGPVFSHQTGYIQGVESDALIRFAAERNAIVRMEKGVGEFVVEGSPLASIAGGGQIDKKSSAQLNSLFAIGRQRTMVQDAGFGVRQIVDIALKALSPGINDTTTAVTCVHYLGAILLRLATRRVETPCRAENGELRVIARGPTFCGLLTEAFDQIRQNAAGNVAVLVAVVQALELVAGQTQERGRRLALKRQGDLVAEATHRSIAGQEDREHVEVALEKLRSVLGVGTIYRGNQGPEGASSDSGLIIAGSANEAPRR